MSMKKFREYLKLVTTAALVMAGAILLFSMVMIAVTADTGALEWLIGFASTAAVLIIKYYMRRAAQKDNLEQRRRYGAEVFEDAKVEEGE